MTVGAQSEAGGAIRLEKRSSPPELQPLPKIRKDDAVTPEMVPIQLNGKRRILCLKRGNIQPVCGLMPDFPILPGQDRLDKGAFCAVMNTQSGDKAEDGVFIRRYLLEVPTLKILLPGEILKAQGSVLTVISAHIAAPFY